MTETHEASAVAAEVAKQAHGGYRHGDNDPEATEALKVDKAVRDRLFPPIGEPELGRPMFESWRYHETVKSFEKGVYTEDELRTRLVSDGWPIAPGKTP